MPSYKITASGNVVIADQAFMVAQYPGGYTLIPDAAPSAPSAPTRKDVIVERLAEIDRQASKPRTMREMMLNKAATISWVTTLDNEAIALRTEFSTL